MSYILLGELEEKIADEIGMKISQSLFGIPGRLMNRFLRIMLSYSYKLGYILLPCGRSTMDLYTSMAQYLNEAPFLLNWFKKFIQTLELSTSTR